jgi:hypothetical protein
MKTYARIQAEHVAELFVTDQDITAMFHRDIPWVDVTSVNGIAVGWKYDGQHFSPPTDSEPTASPVTLLELQAQLAALSSQLAALATTTQAH